MKEELVEHMENFLNDRIPRYQIEIKRGDTHFIASQFVNFHLPLTLPCVSEIKKNFEQKMLHCLWNLAVDDCIDNGGDARHSLEDTTKVLSCLYLRKKARPETPVGKTMNELVERIFTSETCNAETGCLSFFIDAIDQVRAFTYESMIHKRSDMTSFSDYVEYSAITKSMRPWLDIDICMTEEKILSPHTIQKLRKAYRFFELALVYQGDIATFRIELFREKSLNSVLILGLENSVLPPDILDLDPSEKEEIFKKVVPHLFDEIRKLAVKNRDLTLETLKEVKEVNTSSLQRAVIHFIDEEYPDAENERNPTVVL